MFEAVEDYPPCLLVVNASGPILSVGDVICPNLEGAFTDARDMRTKLDLASIQPLS
jgi:hypothetical protein